MRVQQVCKVANGNKSQVFEMLCYRWMEILFKLFIHF